MEVDLEVVWLSFERTRPRYAQHANKTYLLATLVPTCNFTNFVTNHPHASYGAFARIVEDIKCGQYAPAPGCRQVGGNGGERRVVAGVARTRARFAAECSAGVGCRRWKPQLDNGLFDGRRAIDTDAGELSTAPPQTVGTVGRIDHVDLRIDRSGARTLPARVHTHSDAPASSSRRPKPPSAGKHHTWNRSYPATGSRLPAESL
ncbi:unnamed protein product [Phytophthora lilii]|uniref:Unnamed protein product n=1 Tax=Phytophthora lilii TaxID=2077276 RepID=A0A9W6UDM0_9STRA|nr:unnamed protein product [Phytophthora lilii]